METYDRVKGDALGGAGSSPALRLLVQVGSAVEYATTFLVLAVVKSRV
jgi:hypothetical protein